MASGADASGGVSPSPSGVAGLQLVSSCPGKVLLTGGYLVLDNAASGLVVAVSARFRSVLRVVGGPSFASFEAATAAAGDACTLTVSSPQFNSFWTYRISGGDLALVPPPASGGGGGGEGGEHLSSHNPYVEYAIRCALLATAASGRGFAAGTALHLALLADNDFYSQRGQLRARSLPITVAALASLPAHLPCILDASTGRPIVQKTGLGSSAALVSSVVSVFLAALSGNSADTPSPEFRGLCHNVAQIAHGLAQGKIGSGFDVAAAIYGSMRFSRIPPSALKSAMDKVEAALVGRAAAVVAGLEAKAAALKEVEETAAFVSALARGPNEHGSATPVGEWAFLGSSFVLPPCLRLVLADVSGGSETPAMVKNVLAWREAHTTVFDEASLESLITEVATMAVPSNPLVERVGVRAKASHSVLALMRNAAKATHGPRMWRALAAANIRVETAVQEIASLEPSSLEGLSIEELIVKDGREAEVVLDLFHSFAVARALLREVGIAAGVPIEPPEQTLILDDLSRVKGVIAAGVPGAGGYDAFFCIHLRTPGTQILVDAWFDSRNTEDVGPPITPLLLSQGEELGNSSGGLCFSSH